MKTLVATSGLALILLAARPAAAQTEATRWYGWQTLTVDAGVLATSAIAGGATGAVEVPAVTLVAGYLLGGPIVHWAHGRYGTGAASLGVRIGAVAVGTGVGALIGAPMQTDQPFDASLAVGMVLGGLIGATGGMALDAALLARAPARPKTVETSWIPSVGYDPQRRAVQLGLASSF